MKTEIYQIIIIVAGTIALISAFRFGVIGGGAGVERSRNPIVFWSSVTIAALLVIVALVAEIMKLAP